MAPSSPGNSKNSPAARSSSRKGSADTSGEFPASRAIRSTSSMEAISLLHASSSYADANRTCFRSLRDFARTLKDVLLRPRNSCHRLSHLLLRIISLIIGLPGSADEPLPHFGWLFKLFKETWRSHFVWDLLHLLLQPERKSTIHRLFALWQRLHGVSIILWNPG